MPTIQSLTQRLALNQSSRIGLLEDLSQSKLVLWQGLAARLECALFEDTPASDTFVTDITNLDSVNIVVRKNGPDGNILFSQEIVSVDLNQGVTYFAWTARTNQHFTFLFSEVDTTQIVPASGRLPIYFVITAITTDAVPYVAGFGYGEIVDVGYIENPITFDYVLGRTPIVGGKLLTDLDLNGFHLTDSSLVSKVEAGYVALTTGQLEGDVVFQWPKTLAASDLRFDYNDVRDPATPPQVIEVRIGAIAVNGSGDLIGFHYYLSAAAPADSIYYWKVEPKDLTEPTVYPTPRYIEFNSDVTNYLVKQPHPNAVFRSLGNRFGDVVNVKDYGAVGDGLTNDTVAIEAARAYANTSDLDILFPTGTYLITPGGVDWFKCNIYASGATFQTATAVDLPLLKINFTGKSFGLDLRAISGTGSTVGTGVYILGADNSYFRIGSVGSFGVGVHFDGSGANVHIATNDMFVQTIGGCGTGLLMSSANGYACESNRIYVNYIYGCSVAAAKLSNGAYGTGVSDNIIEFVSLELHPTGDGIIVESACSSNRFSVKGILGVGAGSTGKYVITNGTNNRWTLPNFTLSRITKTGNDVIDTISNGIDDGSARSQIAASAPPTSQYWQVGDICWNTARVPSGWRCVVSGTPGTWISIGSEVTGTWTGGSVDDDYGRIQVGVNADPNYGAVFGARRDAGGGVHARIGVKTGGSVNNGLDIFSDGGVVVSNGLPTSDPGAGGFGVDSIVLRPISTTTLTPGRIYFDGTHFYGYDGTTLKQLDN